MKRWGFPVLFLVIFLAPSAVFAATSVSSSSGSSGTTVKAEQIDEKAMQAMIRPMLETYITNHPNINVRIWSMIILTHLADVDEQQLFALPTLVQQMGSKDENIRLIAQETIRRAMDLDEDEWKAIMAPILRTLAKTAKYAEAKKLAIQALGLLQQLDENQLTGLPLLFELAQDDDAEIRKTANEVIAAQLASKSSGGGGGGGVGPR